jgi:hypothetical protein
LHGKNPRCAIKTARGMKTRSYIAARGTYATRAVMIMRDVASALKDQG